MEKKIAGARVSNFTGRDGTQVEGFLISLTSPIPVDQGKGIDAESHYITKAKLDSWGIDIMASIGRTANVFLSRNAAGKITVVGLSVKG